LSLFPLEGKKGDQKLFKHLKAVDSFGFLSDATKALLAALSLHDNEDFWTIQKDLAPLWKQILTDALRTLKTYDARECDPPGSDKYDSFFDQHSLGVEELQRALIESFKQFEGLLYGAMPEGYRDHVVHSIRVWILGQHILKDYLKGTLQSDRGFQIRPVEWECMWAIAALCHDVGYPLEALEKINTAASTTFQKFGLRPVSPLRFEFSPQMLPFHDAMIKLMSANPIRLPINSERKERGRNQFVAHVQHKYYLKFSKSFDSLDHGVVSSLLVARSLVYFLESDFTRDHFRPLDAEDARQMLIRREILRSMASHTCPDIYHLHFNTLSFLLFITDELQYWGRPTLEQMRQGGSDKSDSGKVSLHGFDRRAVKYEFTVRNTVWEKQKDNFWKKLTVVRRMLRLAVGTKVLLHNEFEVKYCVPRQVGVALNLKDGKLTWQVLKRGKEEWVPFASTSGLSPWEDKAETKRKADERKAEAKKKAVAKAAGAKRRAKAATTSVPAPGPARTKKVAPRSTSAPGKVVSVVSVKKAP